MLEMIKPVLGSAAGNLGLNMHFFVLDDNNTEKRRKMDPYQFGELNFQIGERNGELMKATLSLPLNSLYLPRKCPNGKDAHVTWEYCPWTGEKLED